MTNYSLIVAIDAEGAIGKGNGMLVHLPGDLKYFKAVTSNHTVIMGRKTYESLPKGALPNRRNIVLTKVQDQSFSGCEIAHSVTQAMEMTAGEDEVFFIGGGQIYKEVIAMAQILYITKIHHAFAEAEVYFPKIDTDIWMLMWDEKHEKDEKNPYDYTFQKYYRK